MNQCDDMLFRKKELDISWCGNSWARFYGCDNCGNQSATKNKLKYYLVNLKSYRPEPQGCTKRESKLFKKEIEIPHCEHV